MGALDGLTILRYAHVLRDRSSGGAEQYLRALNSTLLERNDVTIVQTHLVASAGSAALVEEERHKRGRLIWVPVPTRHATRSLAGLASRVQFLSAEVKGGGHRSARLHGVEIAGRLYANTLGHLRYPIVVLSERVVEYVNAGSVDLVCLHWMSYDVGTLIKAALAREVPYVVVHHFDNDRLRMPPYRRWLADASGVAGVTGVGVPPFLSERFVRLGDAVDADFFSPGLASPAPRRSGALVLLPARVVEGKGHSDLLESLRLLLDRGHLDVSVAFAGAFDSAPFVETLRSRAAALGLQRRVHFLGDLDPSALRSWYAASDVIVLPSYSEGLPKVLLEAQAMEKPVIAYATGGVPEAVLSERTGYLVRPGDLASLTGTLDCLLSQPARRTDMGRAGRRFVTGSFSTTALAARHERFYVEALRAASRS